MQISFSIHQYLILYDASFLQILQLRKSKFFIVQLKNPLRLFWRHCQSSQDERLVVRDSDDHEPPQRYWQFQWEQLELIFGNDVPFNRVESSKFLVVATTNENFLIVDSARSALTPGDFHVIDLFPFGLYNIKVFASLDLHFVLSIIPSKNINFLSVVHCGKEVPERGHLAFVCIYFFALLEDEEVVVRRSA